MVDEKLKIAMFGHKHMLSREGGVEIVVKELATAMALKGHQVDCYDRKTKHISDKTEVDNRNEYEGVNIIPVFTIEKRGLAALSSSFFAAIKTLHGGYDIIHIHAEGPAAMSWLLKAKHNKIVVTIHGLDWQRAKWRGFAKKYIKWGEKQAVKHADKIIVLSQKMQEYFLTEYGRETVIIPNGANKPSTKTANLITKMWGINKDSYILYVGRIVPEKGINYLIDAWKSINSDKKLVIVGGSSDSENYMKELEKESSNNIVFTGFQQGQVLEELYSNAYLYVLPSDLEGMPLSLLEAMSYGNCCVVSDIPECLEVVGDKAAVFKKGNVEDLRRIIQELITNTKLVNEYKQGASEYICQRYSWADTTDKTLNLYKEILEKN